MDLLPIVARFPPLGAVTRVALGTGPTPVERLWLAGGKSLLVKRDDRFADPVGGNKVRGLEWLLGNVKTGDHVLTVGPRGSTHALATATYANMLAARVTVVRWDQEMNAAARRVDALLRQRARVIDARWVALAYARAIALRVRTQGVVRWIPAGGATPRAIIGHVNAALELVDQVARGECELPARVVVPLGSGGTAAGLWLGFAIAHVPIDVVGVRVVPRIVARVAHVRRLARATRALLHRLTGQDVPMTDARRFRIEHGFFGGAYGRALKHTGGGEPATRLLLDDTYSAKAFQAALSEPKGTLLWLTFDGRLLQH